jgi:hypothetical protein
MMSANHQHQVHLHCPITWPVSGRGHRPFNVTPPVPNFFAPVFFGELQLTIDAQLSTNESGKRRGAPAQDQIQVLIELCAVQ